MDSCSVLVGRLNKQLLTNPPSQEKGHNVTVCARGRMTLRAGQVWCRLTPVILLIKGKTQRSFVRRGSKPTHPEWVEAKHSDQSPERKRWERMHEEKTTQQTQEVRNAEMQPFYSAPSLSSKRSTNITVGQRKGCEYAYSNTTSVNRNQFRLRSSV